MNKDGEFMSLTLSTFKLFLTLAKTDSDVNRIKVTQNGSDIEILTLYGNIMLTMVGIMQVSQHNMYIETNNGYTYSK